MKKEVKISISGMHENDDNDLLEVVSFGEMYEENGETIIEYEEALGDDTNEACEMIQCQLKICEDRVEMLKVGGMKTHMVFVKNEDMLLALVMILVKIVKLFGKMSIFEC